MAKITPPQNIPSELLDEYRKAMGEASIADGVRKRYPFRLPPLQTEVGHPSAKQKAQREVFKIAIDKFKVLPEGDRERWYDTMPEWGSFLWYYNWFMLNAIPNLWGVVPGGGAILKSIQFKEIAMPAGAGEGQVAITEVDPNKCVVMLYGNTGRFIEGDYGGCFIVSYPYVSSLTATLLKCKWAIKVYHGTSMDPADIGAIIIEYI